MTSNSHGDLEMSWKDLLILALIIIGAILFLYGANYYDAVTGYIGVALMAIGIIAEIVLRLLRYVGKKEEV